MMNKTVIESPTSPAARIKYQNNNKEISRKARKCFKIYEKFEENVQTSFYNIQNALKYAKYPNNISGIS